MTPAGSVRWISASRVFTSSITRSAFSRDAHDDDAADGFAASVELGHAAAHVGPDADVRDIRHPDRRALRVRAERNLLDVCEGGQVPARTHHVLAAGELEQASFGVAVAGANRVDDLLRIDRLYADRRLGSS